VRQALACLLVLGVVGCHRGGPHPASSASPIRGGIDPARIAGCYAVGLQWNEASRAQADPRFYQPPRLRLSTAPAQSASGGPLPGYRIEAVAVDSLPERFIFPSWQVKDGEGIRLIWSTGFEGIVLQLRATEQGLTGPITWWDDTNIPGFPAGTAVLQRIPCS
jgi:hypothetical protein